MAAIITPISPLGAGRRAALDFPDAVVLPDAPPKTTSSKSFLVQNVGSKEAVFNLRADDPFRITPARGTLKPGSSLRCNIEFTPDTEGMNCSLCAGNLRF